jgi:hypothetical protein
VHLEKLIADQVGMSSKICLRNIELFSVIDMFMFYFNTKLTAQYIEDQHYNLGLMYVTTANVCSILSTRGTQ